MRLKNSKLNARIKNSPTQMTKHHVPAKCPDKTLRPAIIKKERRHHEAWHLLFGNANYKMCCEILRRDWFPFDEPPNL